MKVIPKVLLAIVVLATIVIRLEQYKTEKNYIVHSTERCDTATQACFVIDCDPADEACGTTPYVKTESLARNTSGCLFEFNCEQSVCAGDSNCTVTECSDETLEEGELCYVQQIDETQ